MGRRGWLNVGMLAAVASLVVVWVLAPDADGPPLPLLTDVDVAALTELRVEAPGQTPAVLRRQGGVWRLAAPVDSAADPAQVERVLGLFTALSVQQYSLGEQEPAVFGLEPPKAVLGGGGVILVFGKLDPLNYRRYVQVGDVLHLIQHSDISMLTAGWPLFVDTRLVAPEHEIVALTLPEVGVVRRRDGHWQVEGDAPADVEALVQAWREVRAVAVERLTPVETSRFVMIEYAGEVAPLRLSVISEEDGLVLGRADLGVEYHFTAAQARRLWGRGDLTADEAHDHSVLH